MALGNIMDAMDGMFERANGAQKMAALDSADAAYKGFATLRDASGAAGRTRQGVFTPGEFLGAVKKGDRTKAKGAFAKGQAYMQDFGNDAQDVLGNTLPNSFSADRWNHTNLAGWLNGAAASPLTLLYAPGIRAAARGVLAPNAGPYRNMLAGMANQYIPQVGSSLLIGANRANLPFAVSPVPPLAIAAPSAR